MNAKQATTSSVIGITSHKQFALKKTGKVKIKHPLSKKPRATEIRKATFAFKMA